MKNCTVKNLVLVAALVSSAAVCANPTDEIKVVKAGRIARVMNAVKGAASTSSTTTRAVVTAAVNHVKAHPYVYGATAAVVVAGAVYAAYDYVTSK